MPLHLLGKKSWNVYNHDNVERVRRDEAEAAAKEAAEEQRMQEVDAERRIRILRGLPVSDLEEPVKDEPIPSKSSQTYSDRDRKRRRVAGEDDTDRDIRYALEAQARNLEHDKQKNPPRPRDISLHDSTGHINLFPEEKQDQNQKSKTGNPELEAEKARKERELEDQYTMRFANARGFKQAVDKKPWYQSETVANGAGRDPIAKNVFGRDDPKRKQREETRMAADDPLAAIKRGVTGVRQAEKDRSEWKAKRRREIDEMVKEEERMSRRRRNRPEEDDLEGFSLDAGSESNKREKHLSHREHRRSHHRSERSRSPRRHHSRHHRHRKES